MQSRPCIEGLEVPDCTFSTVFRHFDQPQDIIKASPLPHSLHKFLMSASPHDFKNRTSQQTQGFPGLLGQAWRNVVSRYNNAISSYRDANRRRLEIRESERIRQKASWRTSWTERLFMLLDYDPTHTESGETKRPTILAAIIQWFMRVIWSQRIEIGGFIFIAAIGIWCYQLISSN